MHRPAWSRRWRRAWPRWTCPSRTWPPGSGRVGSSRSPWWLGTRSTRAGRSRRSGRRWVDPGPRSPCGGWTCTRPTARFAPKARSARACSERRRRRLCASRPTLRRWPRHAGAEGAHAAARPSSLSRPLRPNRRPRPSDPRARAGGAGGGRAAGRRTATAGRRTPSQAPHRRNPPCLSRRCGASPWSRRRRVVRTRTRCRG